MRIFQPFRTRTVALLWAGLTFSSIGDQLYIVALGWIAVSVLGENAGYLTAIEAGVAFFAALSIGRWADQWDRMRSMAGADLVRGLALLVVVVAWLFEGHPSLIGLVAAIVALTIGGSIFDPALQTVLPALVQDVKILPAANALFDATSRSARLVGPGVVALLAAFIPTVHFLTLDALSFFLSAVTIVWIIHQIGSRSARRPSAEMTSGRKPLLHGFRAMAEHPLLCFAIWTTGLLNGLWYLVFFLGLPLLIQFNGVTGPSGSSLGAYGLVISTYGLANLSTTIAIGNLAPSARPQIGMYSGSIVMGLGLILMGACVNLTPQWRLIGFAFAAALGAIGGPLKDVPLAVIRQSRLLKQDIAPAVRAYSAVSQAGILVTLLLAPMSFHRIGVSPTIAVSGLITIVIGIIGMVFNFGWVESYEQVERSSS